MSNIVVCIDGTWNNGVSDDSPSTNVHSLFLSVARSGQIKVYYPGVGTHRGWLARRLEGAAGKGVFQTARLAWQQIEANYEPNDRIFIFGFSRGAYAARHLASMVVRRGLRGWHGTLEQEFREWLTDFRNPDPPIRGLFDCVPANQGYVWRDSSSHLNSPTLERGISHFRHAVSRHEKRWSFRPLIFSDNGQLTFRQHWFPGYHSDVGGGHGIASGLASFSQWWMMREAFGCGLNFNNIECTQHRFGHALSVLRGVDPSDVPIPSDYWTTRLGFVCDRESYQTDQRIEATPDFHELDECPRCGSQMFDYFLTDVGQRWLKAIGLGGQ